MRESRANWRIVGEQWEELRKIPLYHKIAFECNKGWYELLYDLGQTISGYCKSENIPLPTMQQIKEKFGTLRFYYHFQPSDLVTEEHKKQVREWVSEAENATDHICEKCGEPGELCVSAGMWQVACPEHRSQDAMTADEYKIAQEAAQRARTKCDVCGEKGASNYFKDGQPIKLCDSHVGDALTPDQHFEAMQQSKKSVSQA